MRGASGVHGVVVIQHYEAECLMKCGVVAEEKIGKLCTQSQTFKNNHDVNEERLS